MANDPSQDIQDIEDSGGQPAAPPQPAPSMTGAAAPTPSARNEPMEMPPGLANIFGTLGAGLSADRGTPQPMGTQITQQHGGLLTGLAGVLVDGLYAGMAPTRQAAFEAPMKLQEMAMQKQEMAMKQQQLDEEMREAPLREKAMQAQTMINMLHAWGMARDLNETYQLQQTDIMRKATQSAIEDGRATALGSFSSLSEAQQGAKNWRDQHPDSALQVSWVPGKEDAEGNIQSYQLVQFNPKGTLSQDENYTLPGYDDDENNVHIPPVNLHYPAGANQTQVHNDLSAQTANQTAAVTRARDTVAAKEKAKADIRADEREARAEQAQKKSDTMLALAINRDRRQEKQLELKEAGGLYQGTINGRPVAGTVDQLQQAGLGMNQISKLTTSEMQKVNTARDLTSTDPNALFNTAKAQIAELERQGKLGAIASRWNNFWAGKGLDGDMQSFRQTLDLIQSQMMNAHLNRTSVPALEHFQHLVPENSTPQALKLELNNEYKYLLSVAKRPPQ